MNNKIFDIHQEQIKLLEPPVASTDLEKETYYKAQLNNNEWGYNKVLSKFVFKIDDCIYYMQIHIKCFTRCGQTPAQLVGYVLQKNTLPSGEIETCIVQKDMNTMPFAIKDEVELMAYYYRHLQ